jgi:hypothetical protein
LRFALFFPPITPSLEDFFVLVGDGAGSCLAGLDVSGFGSSGEEGEGCFSSAFFFLPPMIPSLPIAFLGGGFPIAGASSDFGGGERLGILVLRGAGAESRSDSDSDAVASSSSLAGAGGLAILGLGFGFGFGDEDTRFLGATFLDGLSSR